MKVHGEYSSGIVPVHKLGTTPLAACLLQQEGTSQFQHVSRGHSYDRALIVNGGNRLTYRENGPQNDV